MDDDLDMSTRAPYISMSESSELPMLIAEDLMWGAQPDLKQTLNINKKLELNINNQHVEPESNGTQMKSYQQKSMESSLASLLCNQLMQHHQQQMHEQQMNRAEQQIILNQHADDKVKVSDQNGNASIVNSTAPTTQTHNTRIGLCWLLSNPPLNLTSLFIF